jgi:3-hydroxyacyl-[acyl-carrier-protein] dehydratase
MWREGCERCHCECGKAGRSMIWDLPEGIAEILSQAAKGPLIPREQRDRAVVLDRAAIEALLPYRDPFLLVDRVTHIDLDGGLIAARYDLARAAGVFAGHFPRHPVWPGVLQVEAIGQAGGILYLRLQKSAGIERVALTRILGARFLRPVRPGGDVELVSRVLEDGLFVTVVGQCLQNDSVCSVAALTAL